MAETAMVVRLDKIKVIVLWIFIAFYKKRFSKQMLNNFFFQSQEWSILHAVDAVNV